MQILIFAIAIVFTLTGFLAKIPLSTNTHSFLSFFSYQIHVILNHSILFGLGCILSIIVFLRIVKFEETHSFHKKSGQTVIQLASILLIGISCSYLFLLCIAWLQLTIFSIMIRVNPSSLNVINNRKEIITKLKTNEIPPEIIASDDTSYNKLIAISSAITGTNTFYGSTILPSIPSFLVIPTTNLGQSILVDNTLIIANVNRQELETLSPIVSYMFIKYYFPERKLRFYPKMIAITDNEYESYRVVDSKEKLKTLDKELLLVTNAVSSSSAALTTLKATISTNQARIPQLYSEKDAQMKKCNAAGHYESGVFKHDHTPLFCQKAASSFDELVVTATAQVDENTKKLPAIENQLAEYKKYETFFTSQKKLSAVLDKNIPHELGVFKPPNTIRILLNTKSSHALADYFATSVHEYLHYASAQEKKSFSILFFEEGFTEYFARQIITENLSTSTNLGYPIFAKIIKQMTKAVPQSDIEEIYFTKDQARLETTLNRVYGDTFYKDNALLFATLQYASNPTQILTTANTIMKHIGGTPFTSQDIFSTQSNL